ncbi:uncharacterized protein LOC102808944 [Saccoglossus kowalevskii]|uniref:Uncharacterized protein LOC102808944 n=1 Tax=Saccoglossus kowalevskii TaxID=10224 RepID=A0ABM0MWD6_SACKO|nr:PREDICTED: uncharacterized protein LOC102808944 [Saccoglossus kowalevskii]
MTNYLAKYVPVGESEELVINTTKPIVAGKRTDLSHFGRISAIKVQETTFYENEDFQNIVDGLNKLTTRLNEMHDILNMTEHMLSAGFAYNGSLNRLHDILLDVVIRNRSLKIGVLGGSISAGGALGGEQYIYSSILGHLLQLVIGERVEIYNVAVGSTASNYYKYCIHAHLNASDMDIIIWEFAINDFIVGIGPESQEELTRFVLALPKKPQLVYVDFVHLVLFRQPHPCRFGSKRFGMHYDVPSISLPNALCTYLEKGLRDGLLGSDNSHPGKIPHAMAAIFLAHLLKDVLQNITREWSPNNTPTSFQKGVDAENLIGELPPPLYNISQNLHRQCWSTLLSKEGVLNDLIPSKREDDWEMMQQEYEEDYRLDRKMFWGCKRKNKSIVFPLIIEPDEHATLFSVYVVMLGCSWCGNAVVFLDHGNGVVIKTYWNWNIVRLFHVANNVPPGNHNITVIPQSDILVRVTSVIVA